MGMKHKLFSFDTGLRLRYSIKDLIEFENDSSVAKQKSRTGFIILLVFMLYSIISTYFTAPDYYHGKVTNVCLALFFMVVAIILIKTKYHTYACLLTTYGVCSILFVHFITETNWDIGMDAFWLFILLLPFFSNYFSGVVYGTISALSGLVLSILLFRTQLNHYLQPYGSNMLEWFPVIYFLGMLAAAIMEYELTTYQIDKQISDEKITCLQEERTRHLKEQLAIHQANELTIRKYKHDMRHFNRVLAGFIKEKEYDKAIGYLQEIDSMLEQVTTVSFCDNQIVNELLTIYTSRCQKLGFKLRAKAIIPDHFPMEKTELTSLVANALENALEAQEKLPLENRFIQFEITYDGKKLKLFSKNPFSGKIRFNDNKLPVSTREVQSGIGTSQIHEIAQKYNGVVSFTTEDGMFVLKAVMTCM